MEYVLRNVINISMLQFSIVKQNFLNIKNIYKGTFEYENALFLLKVKKLFEYNNTY